MRAEKLGKTNLDKLQKNMFLRVFVCFCMSFFVLLVFALKILGHIFGQIFDQGFREGFGEGR